MNSVSKDIIDYMEMSSTGLSWIEGTNLFIGGIPDGDLVDDNAVGVVDTPGYPPAPNYDYFKPGFMIIVRGNIRDYESAYADIDEIREALHGIHGETINGTDYKQVFAAGDVLPIGPDEKRRPILTLNFEVHRS